MNVNEEQSVRLSSSLARHVSFAEQLKICSLTMLIRTKVTHRIWSWSAVRILEETAKCQVLCFTHHDQKRTENREWSHTKLNPEKVLVIRQRYSDGLSTQEQMAVEYGVNINTIFNIINRKSWKDV